MRLRSALLIVASAAALPAHALIAQAPRTILLGKPSAELNETFTRISSVRELSDGRVIVADGTDNVVQLADFKTQKLAKIGRIGSGPAEYKSAGKLRALLNDTTLMEDFVNNRMLVINPNGTAGATRNEMQGPYTTGSSFGLDEHGVTYLTVRPSTAKESGGPLLVIRYDPRTKKGDTITTIARPTGLNSGASSLGNGMLKFFTNLPFAPEDVVAVSRDGRVAVARAENYRIEWYSRDGKKAFGPAVAYTPIEINAAEKKAFMERQVRPGTITVQNNSGGVVPRAPSGNKALYTAETYDDKGMTWPARKPPFAANAISIDGVGRAWVQRATVHTVTALNFDVFDATGKVVMTVTLPPKTKLAGFGAKTVYLAFTDEDDLQHLHRYPMPE